MATQNVDSNIVTTLGYLGRMFNGLCMSSCGFNRRNLIKNRKDEYTRKFI